MEASGVVKGKPQDYVGAFANALTCLGTQSSREEILSQITALLWKDFEALRSELWLWDESGKGAGYLTHSAGAEASHRRDYVSVGAGVLGRVAHTRKEEHNVPLTITDIDPTQTHLAHVSAFPLLAGNKLVGVIANYSEGPVTEDVLSWWHAYSEIAGFAVSRALSTEESQRQIQQLSLLFEATRLLNSTLDLAELLELILRIARTEVKADRGTVFLVDKLKKELWSIVAQGLESQEIRVPFGGGVAGHVAQTGEMLNVADAYELPFFDRSFDQKFGYRTKSLLCLPIRHKSGEIVGVLQLLNQTIDGKFTRKDEDFLNKLSGHMAMALENARLHREALEKQRMERDLAVARQIQRSLLPEHPPAVQGYDIAVLNEPCFECGGDYYDFLNLGPQTLLAVIADVEGKGVGSALVMSNLQATLRALAMHLHSLEVLMLSLNEMIYNDTKSEKFLSCFLGLIDTRRNGLHYINAGHCPPLVVRGKDGSHEELSTGGTVIGLFPDSLYQRGSVQLEPGDILVCCTDGITEACNTNEEEFGIDGLAKCVAMHRAKSAQQIVDAVLAEVTAFSRGGPHQDDKVLMLIKVTASGELQQAVS
ncbi:MAG TPA: SpoIIE family protein phosphatase [Terriglobales bacterium]|nr:SpoIIE family protein phosphatase [Terriglobales bacterium]